MTFEIKDYTNDRVMDVDSKSDGQDKLEQFDEMDLELRTTDGAVVERNFEPEEPKSVEVVDESEDTQLVESDAETVEASYDETDVLDTQPTGEINPAKEVHDPLALMPGWMKSEIQHGNGDTGMDLNKKGTQVIADSQGYEVNAECEISARESEWEYCRYRATVETPDGRTYNAVGDCHIDEQGKNKWDLERMAETRAKKRAVKWASGGGLEVFRQ